MTIRHGDRVPALPPVHFIKITAVYWPGHEVVDPLRRRIRHPNTAWVVFDRQKAPVFSSAHVIKQAMLAGPFTSSGECHEWIRLNCRAK